MWRHFWWFTSHKYTRAAMKLINYKTSSQNGLHCFLSNYFTVLQRSPFPYEEEILSASSNSKGLQIPGLLLQSFFISCSGLATTEEKQPDTMLTCTLHLEYIATIIQEWFYSPLNAPTLDEKAQKTTCWPDWIRTISKTGAALLPQRSLFQSCLYKHSHTAASKTT